LVVFVFILFELMVGIDNVLFVLISMISADDVLLCHSHCWCSW